MILTVSVILQISTEPVTLWAQPQPDFTLSANPSYFYPYSLNWGYPGPTWNANITATSVGGFAGTLNYTLAYSSIPVLQLSVAPFIVTLGSGQSMVSTLAATFSSRYSYLPPASNWTITVTATSGSLSHSVNIIGIDGGVEVVQQLGPTVTFQPGGDSVKTNVTVTAVNFIGGTVQLSVRVKSYNDGFVCKQYPNVPTAGFSTTLSSYSIQLPANKSVNVTLTVSANSSSAPGTYHVVVSITPPDGVPLIENLGYVDVTVPGFVLSNLAVSGGGACESGLPLSIPRGGVGETLILVRAPCLDTTLTVLSVPPGINATLVPTIVRNSASATLKLAVSQAVAPGNYTILVGGSSCGQTASTLVPLTVTTTGSGTVYWIIWSSIAGVAAATLVALGIIMIKRRRTKMSAKIMGPSSNSV